jgi:hypothetical protein
LSTGTLQTTFDRVLVKSGLRTIEHETEMVKNRCRVRKEVSRFNGFRKFFNTNLIKNKVNPAVKEMLMGHSIDLDDNYYRPPSDEILEEYLKAVNLLTINEENRLKIKVKELTRKVSRFDALEEKLQAVEKKLGLSYEEDDDNEEEEEEEE